MIPTLPLILALVSVESNGNDQAIGAGGELGCLQISPCIIEDVNRFVRRPNFYKLHDRTNRAISMQIFRRYINRYSTPLATAREMALLWHFGPAWHSKIKTAEARSYWAKVKKAMGAQ